MRLYMDYETYCELDLKVVGDYRYAEHPSFEPLMLSWALDDDPVQVVEGAEAVRELVTRLMADKRITSRCAHKAQFERICTSRILGMPVGEYLDPEGWHDTMSVAAVLGLPQSLGALAKALGAEGKDTAGTRLINLFCKPRAGKRTMPEDRPDDWAAFVAYGRQDTETLRDVDRRMGPWPTETERQVWIADQLVNDNGIKVDLPLVRAAIATAADNAAEQLAEVRTISGIDNPNSNPQMLKWLRAQGVMAPNLQAATVEDLLLKPLPPDVRRVLELRQELALVASKKFTAVLASVSGDGRLRGSFRYHGAHTGRWTSRGAQLHNLPRAGFKSPLPKHVPEHIHARAIDTATEAAALDVKLGLGVDAQTLKALVRSMFLGPFTIVDYSAIEARVLAWLADELWALEAFKAGRDIYVETAQRMSTPHKQLTRSDGKVAVLALGYNGGINSLRHMGAEGTDDHLQTLVTQWRMANSNIVQLWATMEQAFRKGGPVGRLLCIERDGTTRRMRLPSGRALAYHNFRTRTTETPWGPRVVCTFRDPRTGAQVATYGGRLVENATQAVARDVLAESIVRLQRRGYPIAGHVHDEVLVEAMAPGSLQAVRIIMNDRPSWAKDLPIGSEGFTCPRYRKG